MKKLIVTLIFFKMGWVAIQHLHLVKKSPIHVSVHSENLFLAAPMVLSPTRLIVLRPLMAHAGNHWQPHLCEAFCKFAVLRASLHPT